MLYSARVQLYMTVGADLRVGPRRRITQAGGPHTGLPLHRMEAVGQCDKAMISCAAASAARARARLTSSLPVLRSTFVMNALIFAVKSPLTTTSNTPEAQRWNSSKNPV